jgi:hypothetical protein
MPDRTKLVSVTKAHVGPDAMCQSTLANFLMQGLQSPDGIWEVLELLGGAEQAVARAAGAKRASTQDARPAQGREKKNRGFVARRNKL